MHLEGKKVAILIENQYEDQEFWYRVLTGSARAGPR